MAFSVRKTWGIFNPNSKEPHRISRSKIDLFIQCPRCFYFDQRLGVNRPSSFPFTLNNAVDLLMKKEFDLHRAGKTPHPLMKAYGIDAVPFNDPRMEEWRDAMKRGIMCVHKPTNLCVRGGIDDVWVTPDGELHIVDYKATSKNGDVNLDAEWQDGYKRQMEIYQWLFRQNNFKVSKTGYFVYVNGKTDKEAFDAKLEFDLKIIPYEGDDSWVEKTIVKLKECLMDSRIPKKSKNCEHCEYFEAVVDVMKANALLNATKKIGKEVTESKKEEEKLEEAVPKTKGKPKSTLF